jgi:hypothetical protein
VRRNGERGVRGLEQSRKVLMASNDRVRHMLDQMNETKVCECKLLRQLFYDQQPN